MELEQFFDFLAPDDIRIRGSRVGIESVLYEYIHREQSPESIVQQFPSLTLEQIYAVVLYYLHNQEKIRAYMEDWMEYGRRMRQEQSENPPAVVARLRALKEERNKLAAAS